ncbi:ketosynthase chain-length factor [Nocardia transvalensis]|uniref:ketosynthase chain-length factor n=1 Tax=Nocardia transvalensis TaxID=37333 RepID=UPI001894FE72|nr:ketosynthase chain-length factor [Nocardia transvalensis]MBF6328255.1 ketosynthase chain-length factor [Nocardia transvalensis]
MSSPTVVTGASIVAASGLGLAEHWKSLLAGEIGFTELTRFDVSRYPAKLAGQVRELDPAEHLHSRLLPQTDVSTQLALITTDWALADAGIDVAGFDDYSMGVATANALGGFEFTHREFQKLWSRGPEYVSVYESFAWFYAVNTGQISIRNGMRGPSMALVGEQAGGLDAIGHARRTIRSGTTLMTAGGVDSALDPWGWSAQHSGGRLSTTSDPQRAYLPFDEAASGYIPGEGGAILIMEELGAARERGVRQVLGEIAGYAATFDPPPGSQREPGLRRAIETALADAGVTPAQVDVVFADAAGVPELDRIEADAISAVFGPWGVPVTAPKAMFGRLYAGGGPVDVVTALLAIRDGVVPHSGNTTTVPDSYQLDLVVGQPRDVRVRTALVLARGRWGFNSAIVVTAIAP